MKLYDGGSDNDELLSVGTGNYTPSLGTSSRNQMFITFIVNGNEVGKGFTANIAFGNRSA